tara:strand:- start:144 stop:587 length:444 start_codon:yes stop_codon:yes gene_type:complete
MTKKVLMRKLPYSFWHEEYQLNQSEIEYTLKLLNADSSLDGIWKATFDAYTGDMIVFLHTPDDDDDYPFVNWEQLETFLFNQKNWEIARRMNANGEDVILDAVDDNGNFKGTSHLIFKEHKFGKNMSDLLKAGKSPLPIPPPKGFGN